MKKPWIPEKWDEVVFRSKSPNKNRRSLNGERFTVRSVRKNPLTGWPDDIAVELRSKKDQRETWAGLDELRPV